MRPPRLKAGDLKAKGRAAGVQPAQLLFKGSPMGHLCRAPGKPRLLLERLYLPVSAWIALCTFENFHVFCHL